MIRMNSRLIAPLLFLAAVTTLFGQAKTNRFDKEILAFENSDRTNPPPKDAILFIGSSSIRMWKTVREDFPDLKVINRGFGGSEVTDSTFFADRIIFPYEPKMIVFYAGGNDIHSGKSAETVFANYQTFVQTVHAKLPKTKIAYISIAPNPARWSEIERVRKANSLIENYNKTDKRLSFIDVHPVMLGEDHLPKPDIYLKDKLHMNASGYALWTKVVGDHLKALLAEPAR